MDRFERTPVGVKPTDGGLAEWTVRELSVTVDEAVHDPALDAARALMGVDGELRLTLRVEGTDVRLSLAVDLPDTFWSAWTAVIGDDVAAAVDELTASSEKNGPRVAVLMTVLSAPAGRAALVATARRLWTRAFAPPLAV